MLIQFEKEKVSFQFTQFAIFNWKDRESRVWQQKKEESTVLANAIVWNIDSHQRFCCNKIIKNQVKIF